jgi:hypothetical protein
MTFPIIPKPKSVGLLPRIGEDYSNEIIEVPNLITIEQVEKLKDFARDKESGLHRRGSKDLNTIASFYTCLVFRYNDPIYELLDYSWYQYGKQLDNEINFIEPYEIKIYNEGDKFDRHHDSCANVEISTCRKINLIIQLTDESEYDGGDLLLGSHVATRKMCTGIFFPADRIHAVTTITRGSRVSLIGHAWKPYSK